MALTDEQTAELRAALKRCSPETLEAALRFRDTGDAQQVPTVVYGIIERHLSAEDVPRLAAATEETRLVEDLGIDSLTLLEIVLSIEETLGISINNDELRDVRTFGGVKSFISAKVSGIGAVAEADAGPQKRRFDRDAVATVLPQQYPFLFVDEAELEGDTVRASYTVRGDEYFLEGHFKGNPVFPASIVFEALGQAACLWILQSDHDALAGQQGAAATAGNGSGHGEVLFASMETAHFHRRAQPGDRLDMEARLHRIHPPLAIFNGTVKVGGARLAEIERLVLAFGPGVAEHLSTRAQEEPAAEEGKEKAADATSGQTSG
ncbi:MAG: FabA-like domain protein [Verrucomicrobia bacterium]|nr:FabA-like domain protein [Verrucomicrobiota bacterium]